MAGKPLAPEFLQCVPALPRATESQQLPVTVLVGSLGAGKTTVLRHLLGCGTSRMAVIVNDIAEVSLDLQQLRHPRAGLQFAASSEVVGGCLCCTRREAFLEQICLLATKKDLDGIIVEAAGIAEPLHVVENFALVQDVVRLDTIAAIVDAGTARAALDCLKLLSTFHKSARASIMNKKAFARPRNMFTPEIKLIAEQVTFANVILLCKCDEVSEVVASELLVVLQRLNPEAQIHRCAHGAVPRAALLNTGLFSMQVAEGDDRWFAEAHAEARAQRLFPLAEQLQNLADAALPQQVPEIERQNRERQQMQPQASCSRVDLNGNGVCGGGQACGDCTDGSARPCDRMARKRNFAD